MRQRHEVALTEPQRSLQAEPGTREGGFDRDHVADLLPAGLHDVLLESPQHLGPEPCGNSAPWIGVELAEPGVVVVRDRGAPDVGACVYRRADCRSVLGRLSVELAVGRIGQHACYVLEAGAERGRYVSQRRVGHRRLRCGTGDRRCLEGAVHVEEPFGVAGGQVGEGRGVTYVHFDPADAGGGLVRLEAPCERLEVALWAGLETPVVVDGQHDGVRGRPCRLQLGVGGDAAEASDHAGVEGGDDARDPGGVRLEPSRADQARHVAVGVIHKSCPDGLARAAGVLVEQLDVCPCPRVGQVGQLAGGAGLDRQLRQDGAASAR